MSVIYSGKISPIRSMKMQIKKTYISKLLVVGVHITQRGNCGAMKITFLAMKCIHHANMG